jgi:hypothetical protein
MKNILLYLLLFFTPLVYSQNSGGFGNSKNWSLNKHEIYFSIGTSQFLGDLGGLDKEGTQKSLVDLDFSSTRIGGGIGYRYRFHRRWATSTQLYFGMVSGADANTDEVIRRSRNLSFRSPILELSQRIEFIIYSKEQGGARYSRLGTKGRSTKADFFYVFSGISGFYFNPQTKINGSWTNLRPLKTEGQGLPGGQEEYGKFSMAIPMGVGFKFAIGKYWRLGLEISYNKTFTDYIDDVSTDYYDPAILAKSVGKDAVYAANPSIENHTWFTEGQQRGNPDDNDGYLFTNITVTRNITNSKSKGMSRSRWNGRTKF